MKYRCYAIYTASKYLGTVDANSEIEAEAKGEELDCYPSLCHQCAGEIELGDAYEVQVEADE